jgi:hypothetical protein
MLVASATPALGQERVDPVTEARIHLGPLGITPAIGLSNFGIDSNVFNEVTEPKRDVTATITPRLDGWMRLGRARVSALNRLDLVYFATYAGERSLNARQTFGVEASLRRLRPFGSVGLTNTRERPGFEIDARSRRREVRLAMGGDLRLTPKTSATGEVSRTTVSFDAAAIFDGTYLHEVLNRRHDAASVGMRHALTPLTTVVSSVNLERTRFDHSSDRDADSVRVVSGLELAPSALVSGRVTAGMRAWRPLDTAAPPFTGMVGAADVSYVLLGANRLSFRAARDLDYSYDKRWPYYVATGFTAAVRRQVAASWDAQVSIGRQSLAYRASSLAPADAQRRDRVSTLGIGAGYRLGRTSRLFFSVDRTIRRSELPGHGYSGLQSGFSLAYDL